MGATGPALPRGRHGLSREHVQATQRGRMLVAVAEVMSENGYAATPVADVIRRAGVSRETFYEHFANKQECFLAAYDEAVQRLTDHLRTAMGHGATAAERLDRGLGAYLEAMAAEPGLAQVFLIEVYAAGPGAWRRRADVLEQFADVVADVLREDPAAATLPDVDLAARALVGAVSSMVTGLLAADDAAALVTLREPIRDLLAALARR